MAQLSLPCDAKAGPAVARDADSPFSDLSVLVVRNTPKSTTGKATD